MKKLFFYIILLILLNSCGGGLDDAKKVLKNEKISSDQILSGRPALPIPAATTPVLALMMAFTDAWKRPE